MKFLSMAALALVGAMMTGCSSSDDSIADIPQQPEVTNKKTVTLTTTVGLDAGATTRALTGEGVKTFAVGEQMAIVYSNGSGMVKAVSRALKADDIKDAGTIASFTFDLETPDKSIDVTYIYPASMARADGSINYNALANQDGTLASLASNLDLATYEGEWLGENLPSCTLDNQLAILACTIKKHAGDDITSSITSMTVSDGSNTYAVSRSAAAGPIYVAICPTTNATINVTATNATRTYYKTLATKTYEASNGYPVSWKMDLPVLDIAEVWDGEYTVTEDMVITGSNGGFAIYTDGSHEITLDNVTGDIHLNLDYSMTIKLIGENRLTSIHCDGDVTIDDAGGGDGTLVVIDGAIPLQGNFIIKGGTVKAKATNMGPALNGDLTVNGGAVYLAGGDGNPAVFRTLTVNDGAVYLAGGDGAQAVGTVADGNATLYGWHENYGWKSKEDWMGQDLGEFNSSQYITTDAGSGDPTDPGISKWNW